MGNKLNITIDFSMLSKPYRLKRCSYQLMHLAIIAERLEHNVSCIVTKSHYEKHKFLKRINRLLKYNRNIPTDIYIAKSDAFYVDKNWSVVEKLPGLKVCLCNSDRTFRETNVPFRKHRGNPVQERCDLYMPCNHTAELLEKWEHKVVPVSHPIDPRMYKFLVSKRLYYAYLMDDINKLRKAFCTEDELDRAGFMGNQFPVTRLEASKSMPSWCDFRWERAKSSEEYISWIVGRRGCLDMRGYGDKSLRFAESAMLGRTLICQNLPSKYSPLLVNNHNCILVDEWQELNDIEYDRSHWLKLSEQSTHDYLNGWSLLSQMRTIIERGTQ